MPDRSRKNFWYVSPLTYRILAVNVAALLLLVLGLLYTGRYERGLLDFGMNMMSARGRMFAAAVAAGMPTQNVLHSMSAVSDTRLIVFDKNGRLVVDSRGEGAAVPPSFTGRGGNAFEGFAPDFLPARLRLPQFPDTPSYAPAFFPGVTAALKGGAPQTDAWHDRKGRILLTTTAPVPGGQGAVFLARPGGDVDEAVRGVQLTVLKAFLASLLVTILLTLYLSETIVTPLVRLADATDKVRQSILLKDAVPDLSWRGDEIGDLSRAFREMMLALSERIDAVSRFASDVAHEIKNPLASVKSAVETFPLVKEEAQRQKLLAVINDDINRINRLITDISNASRLDSELSRSARKTFDLAVLLRNVIEAERSRTGTPDKIVLYLDEGQRLPVTGNEVQLAQVTHNLIDNALSFVSEGSQISVRAGLQGDRVFLHIDNPGPPIPESKLEAVFERFYSERPRAEKFGTHSGLGLSISRQIVRMHQGEIFAENLKDRSGAAKGVRFKVLLPAGPGTK